MKVKVTTHWKRFKVKPTRKDVSYVRNIRYTEVETVTVEELAKIFKNGRTIACGYHEPTAKMQQVIKEQIAFEEKYDKKDPDAKNYYISSRTFKNQQVFAVDLDDGNLTLEELKARIKLTNMAYAIIYKTFSYREDDKRWRIVFINDKVVHSAGEVEAIYQYLIWKLHSNTVYTESELAKIDISGTDIGRLTFGAKEVVEVHENATCSVLKEALMLENQILAEEFIKSVRLAKKKKKLAEQAEREENKKAIQNKKTSRLPIPELGQHPSELRINNYLDLLEEEFAQTGTISVGGGLPLDTLKKERINDVSSTFDNVPSSHFNHLSQTTYSLEDESAMYDLSLSARRIYEIICQNLREMDEELKPLVLDYTDRYDYINSLKLTDLLRNDEVEIKENRLINCLLVHHDDKTPSGIIRPYKSNSEYQFYHCYGCETSYKTFDFIDHIFEAYALLEGRKHSTKATLELVYSLLDIELGSRYQKRVERQIKHDKGFIRDLKADSDITKLLNRKRMVGFIMDLYEIADMKLSYESILQDDKDYSICFVAANTFISNYMKRLGHEGSSQSQVNKKLNWLAKAGFLEKITFDALTKKEKMSMMKYKVKTLKKEGLITGEMPKKQYKDKDICVYKIKPLSESLMRNIVDFARNEQELGCRSQGQGKAQTTAAYGAERSQEVYTQDNVLYTKRQELYLKLAGKAIEKLLAEQGCFTEKELDKNIDTGRNHKFKMAEKESLRLKLYPALKLKYNLSKKRCNKELRERFNLSENVKCNIVFVD